MHILQDENGNPLPHGHGQEHPHECQEHCHGHEGGPHCHSHGEEGCGHGHGDCPHAQEPAEKNAALLKYMLDHNTHHAAELDRMAQKLEDEGHQDAALQIRKAVDEFQKGNLYLNLASMVK